MPQPLTAAYPPPPQTPQSIMLQIAATELEKEESRRETEKQSYLTEHCPPLHIPGSMAEVQVPRPPPRPPARPAGPAHRPVSPTVQRASRVVRAGGGHPPTHGTRPPPPQELCQQLHAKINVAEEEKYDMEVKVQKSIKEVRGRGGGRGAGGARTARSRPPPPPAQPCRPPRSWRT